MEGVNFYKEIKFTLLEEISWETEAQGAAVEGGGF